MDAGLAAGFAEPDDFHVLHFVDLDDERFGGVGDVVGEAPCVCRLLLVGNWLLCPVLLLFQAKIQAERERFRVHSSALLSDSASDQRRDVGGVGYRYCGGGSEHGGAYAQLADGGDVRVVLGDGAVLHYHKIL